MFIHDVDRNGSIFCREIANNNRCVPMFSLEVLLSCKPRDFKISDRDSLTVYPSYLSYPPTEKVENATDAPLHKLNSSIRSFA